ncbi:MAG: Uma2 family endonuclease [Planctomycetes bacterium]|nr:Uma2 family endonuclease [Planctomycetota bacterium]
MTTPRIPELAQGDCLKRDEFERRYAAMPALKKAELIEGVVYLGSPVNHVRHGRPHADLGAWLGFYRALSPGLVVSDNATLRLDLDNEPQPDLLLALPPHAGSGLRSTADGYLEGPPELVIEVAASSVSYDLHQKKNVYRRNGVREYLVHRVEDEAVDWFVAERGVFVAQQPDDDGLLRGAAFPGLWLDVGALLAGDLGALRAAVERGCATAEHAAFRRRLAAP